MTIDNVALAISIFNNGDYILMLALGIIGALIFLHSRNLTGPAIALVSIAAVLVILPQMLDIISMTGLLPGQLARIFICIAIDFSHVRPSPHYRHNPEENYKYKFDYVDSPGGNINNGL